MFKFIWRIVILISTSYGIYGGVYMAPGQPNSGFLLYYTTQSNLWCCLFFLYLMMTNRKRPWIKGGITAAIIVTFILYQFIIVPYCLKYGSMHHLFSPADIAVHYLSPFLVVMDMILFDKNQDYSWYIPFQWLLIPIIYFFLDITDIGIQSFIHNIIGITLIFLVAGYFVLIINQIKSHLH